MKKSNVYIIGLAVAVGALFSYLLPERQARVRFGPDEYSRLVERNAPRMPTGAVKPRLPPEGPSTGPEALRHGFGTEPGRRFMPASCVDTDELPNLPLQASDGKDEPLPSCRLAGNTHFLYGNIAETDEHNRGWTANAGFVVTGDGVVVIDALGTPKLGARLIATVRQVTDEPIRYLIITHPDADHVFGAVAFRRLGGVTVIANNGVVDYFHSERFSADVVSRRAFTGADMQGFDAVEPDYLVPLPRFEPYVFRAGDTTFRLYGSGSNRFGGDLLVEQVEQGIVWVSDLAVSGRVPALEGQRPAAMLEALDWLEKAFPEARLMIPGHGSAQSAPFPMVTQTRAYVEHLRESLNGAIGASLPPEQAIARAEAGPWRDLPLYGRFHRANAEAVYAELGGAGP